MSMPPSGLCVCMHLVQGKSFFDKRDVAGARLFNRVNEQLLRKPTFASFIRLLVRTDATFVRTCGSRNSTVIWRGSSTFFPSATV